MILDEPGRNVSLAAFLVRQLMQLRSLNPKANIDAALEPLLPFTFQSASYSTSGADLGFYYGGNNSRKIFFIDGVANASQTANLINGYDVPSVALGFSGRNPYITQQAQRIVNVITAPGLQVPEHVDFVGYSAGGAVAVKCKLLLLQAQSVIKSKAITFGSPRAANFSDIRPLASSPITRWMTPADPIPLIPPRVTDVPALLVTNGVLTNQRWGSFTHTHGGIVVDVNGNCAESTLPPLAAINASTALAGWYFSEENDPNNPHALTTYLAYLNRAVQVATSPANQNKEEGPAERPQEDDRRRLTQQENQTLTQIANAGHAQNKPVLVIPAAVLFRAQRIGRTWVLTFGGEVLAVAPFRKRAQALARSGNAFLRRLPRQALVDPDQLASSVQQYLAAATDPLSGFQPQLKTEL